jgi:hypothetical protein
MMSGPKHSLHTISIWWKGLKKFSSLVQWLVVSCAKWHAKTWMKILNQAVLGLLPWRTFPKEKVLVRANTFSFQAWLRQRQPSHPTVGNNKESGIFFWRIIPVICLQGNTKILLSLAESLQHHIGNRYWDTYIVSQLLTNEDFCNMYQNKLSIHRSKNLALWLSSPFILIQLDILLMI